jgi:hypothetical protein
MEKAGYCVCIPEERVADYRKPGITVIGEE